MNNDQLAQLAKDIATKAYAPYSNFRVGAALITDSGNVYSGCNIENASYPASVCAEDVAVVKAISEGEKKINTIAVACIDAESDTAIFPCGISRQRLAEFDTEFVLVVDETGYKTYKFEEILPNDRIEISFQIKSKFSRSVKITLRGKFKNQKY